MNTNLNKSIHLKSALNTLLIRYHKATTGSKEKNMLQQSIILLKDIIEQLNH